MFDVLEGVISSKGGIRVIRVPFLKRRLYCMHFSAGACAGKNDACKSFFYPRAPSVARIIQFGPFMWEQSNFLIKR